MKKLPSVIEVYEEWRIRWSTPDISAKEDKRKKNTPDNRIYLKEHTEGEIPFVKFQYLDECAEEKESV